MTPEALARLFHDTYERLAPEYRYVTRPESAVPWKAVPLKNKRLMIAVAREVLAALQEETPSSRIDEPVTPKSGFRI